MIIVNITNNNHPNEKMTETTATNNNPETIDEQIMQPGDLYWNTIYKEDCVQKMRQMLPDSIDVILCEPPNNGNGSLTARYVSWCDKWIHQCLRVLKPNGVLYIYGERETMQDISKRIYCNVTTITMPLGSTPGNILCCYKRKNTSHLTEVDVCLANNTSVRKKYSTTKTRKHMIEPIATPTPKKTRHVTKMIKKMLLPYKTANATMVMPFVHRRDECTIANQYDIRFIGFETMSPNISQ